MLELTDLQLLACRVVAHVHLQASPEGGWRAALNPDAPEWIADLLRRVHTELEYPLPDAWLYAFTDEACQAIANSDGSPEGAAALVRADEDSLCLARWLADDPMRRAALCDRAQLAAQPHADLILVELLKGGQQREKLAVFVLVYQQLEAVLRDKEQQQPTALPSVGARASLTGAERG